MGREAIPTWFFALVVVRSDDRFLLVHERKHGQLHYLPAGRVEPGETLVMAAERETLEEAGIRIVIEGILRIEHTPYPDRSARVRVIFVARPFDATPPKSVPDEESLGAGWYTLEQAGRMPLRSREVMEIFEYVARGGRIHPLELLAVEGARFRIA